MVACHAESQNSKVLSDYRLLSNFSDRPIFLISLYFYINCFHVELSMFNILQDIKYAYWFLAFIKIWPYVCTIIYKFGLSYIDTSLG